MEYTLDQVIEKGIASYIPNKNNPEVPKFSIFFYPPNLGAEDSSAYADMIQAEIDIMGFAIVDSNDKIIRPEDAPKEGWLHREDCKCSDCADSVWDEFDMDLPEEHLQDAGYPEVDVDLEGKCPIEQMMEEELTVCPECGGKIVGYTIDFKLDGIWHCEHGHMITGKGRKETIEENKPKLTKEQIERGTEVLQAMHKDVHDIRDLMLDLATKLIIKWPKEEIEWMMEQAKLDEKEEVDPLAPAITQSIIEVLKLANTIREDIEKNDFDKS